jgi:hypothetical protein
MIAPGELAIERRLTSEFIAADSVVISLVRKLKVPDGKGGYRLSDVPLAPQTLRLIPSGDGATERTTTDGKAVSPDYMLMGTYLADMQRGDVFLLGDRRYEVVFINENKQYQIKGEVAYRAGL